MSIVSTDVVIVGAGPVGLVAASELARRNVDIRVIDKLPVPTRTSRAIGIHGRSLDMFDRMGIADELVATGIKTVAFQMYADHKPLFRVPLSGVDAAFPFMLTTAQTETERVLGEHLSALGVSVERGVELVGLSQDSTSVVLQLMRPDGSTERASASWVIGADGASSAVRALLGTKLEGTFSRWRWMVADVDADHHLDEECAHMFLSAEGPLVAMPMRDGRMRFLAQLHTAATPGVHLEPTQDELQQILDRRVGGIKVVCPHWMSYFQIHSAQVPNYRWRRVLLAGDAGHIHSPAGGQGMNTGMQDAFNLAWKLAAVINGDAGGSLLDSYNAERYPVARQVLKYSGELTEVWQTAGLSRRIRDVVVRQLSHVDAARRAMANAVEEVNVNYVGGPLAAGNPPHGSKVAAGQHFPHIAEPAVYKQLRDVMGADNLGHSVITVPGSEAMPAPSGDGRSQILVVREDSALRGYDAVVTDPRGTVAERLGLAHGGRVVVRPDGYIGAVATLDDTTTVADYFARVAG